MAQPKAYGLLAEQPLSATDVVLERALHIVISAILGRGWENARSASRYGDLIWELWPFFEQSNVAAAKKKIN